MTDWIGSKTILMSIYRFRNETAQERPEQERAASKSVAAIRKSGGQAQTRPHSLAHDTLYQTQKNSPSRPKAILV